MYTAATIDYSRQIDSRLGVAGLNLTYVSRGRERRNSKKVINHFTTISIDNNK